MNKSVNVAGIALVVSMLVFAFGVIGIYNSLKSARIDVDTKYSQVEVQIQRRADLIPNLVATVKGYM